MQCYFSTDFSQNCKVNFKIFTKISEFHKRPCDGNRFIAFGQTDGRDEANSRSSKLFCGIVTDTRVLVNVSVSKGNVLSGAVNPPSQ